MKHPNWTLVKIYADKGISGTSTKHRIALNQMLADSRAGKIDLIITKSVSRLARNTVDCITMVRNLAELRNPVGVFFESECIFSLNEDTSMPLSFLASIAENESRIRSRSMEVSLAQRLNGGLPLTPKLLGYSHDTDGKLVINPDEAPTVKLIFYMYLSGYSSAYHEHQKSLQINIFDGYAIYGIKDNTVSSIASGEAATPIPGTHRPEVPVQEEIKMDSADNSAIMTIDLSRGRFRVHKSTLNKMGRPQYIQFLVNPEEMLIAILGSDRPLSGGTANNVQQFQLTKHSVEFYSSTLMSALVDMIGILDFRYSYRVSGEVDVANRVAYFSMKTLKRNER